MWQQPGFIAIRNENGILYNLANKLERYSVIGVIETFRPQEVID